MHVFCHSINTYWAKDPVKTNVSITGWEETGMDGGTV